DQGLASPLPAGFRVRIYEVSNIPGPPNGQLPQAHTNVEDNSCCGIGTITPSDPETPNANPSFTIAAANWSDFIAAPGFFIFVVAPDGGAGIGNYAGNVTSVAGPFVLDDAFGPTAVAYLDGGAADSDHTATFSWTNTGSWSVSAAAWEV